MKRTIVVSLLLMSTVMVIVFIATAPHPWIGKTACTVRGGEWTNRFPQHVNEKLGIVTDQIVTAGRQCIAN